MGYMPEPPWKLKEWLLDGLLDEKLHKLRKKLQKKLALVQELRERKYLQHYLAALAGRRLASRRDVAGAAATAAQALHDNKANAMTIKETSFASVSPSSACATRDAICWLAPPPAASRHTTPYEAYTYSPCKRTIHPPPHSISTRTPKCWRLAAHQAKSSFGITTAAACLASPNAMTTPSWPFILMTE